jgi:pimeloyl-ACP methyl ester carboxylesterase
MDTLTRSWETGKMFRFRAGKAELEGKAFGPAPQGAPTIVMLHEGLGSVGLWRDFPEKLAAATGMGVFAYSRRGYGGSDKVDVPRPLDYMTREAVDVLPDVLAAIGFQKGMLLGHSDGASIAALYLGHFQDVRVRGLVLIAPHFFTEPDGLASIAQAREAYQNGDLRDKLARHHKDADGTFWGWNRAWLDPGFKAWNITEALDYIRVPVLAIQGLDDQYGTQAQIDVIEERLYAPFERVMLEGCRHSPFIDKPAETLAAISEFAKRLDRIEREKVAVK